MPVTRASDFRPGDRIVLVGTMKGAFVFRGRGRGYRRVGGPHFPGQPVYALAYDDRGGRERGCGPEPSSMHLGSVLRSSDDFGRTWSEPEEPNIKFPADTGLALKQIWQIAPGARRRARHALLRRRTRGAVRVARRAARPGRSMRGLYDHPHRPQWTAGRRRPVPAHDPPRPRGPRPPCSSRSRPAASTAPTTAARLARAQQGVRAEFLPDKYPEFGQCVHKVVPPPGAARTAVPAEPLGALPQRRRRRLAGRTSRNGVPSDFGFAMAMPPARSRHRLHRAARVGRVPLHARGQAARLPHARRRRLVGAADQRPAAEGRLETVLRDALTTDAADPAGVYFGTRSGKLFASRSDGGSWECLAEGLPPVTCVRAALVRGVARPAARPRTLSRPRRPGASRPRARRSR